MCLTVLIKKNDLGGPVQAGDNTMLGPALIHELPVERQLCPGLDFTGENKAPQINKKHFFKNLTSFLSFFPIITPPSPPDHDHCSQRRGPHALTVPAQ